MALAAPLNTEYIFTHIAERAHEMSASIAAASPGSRDFEEILQYINDAITPHLRNVLKAVGESRPEDPIGFIAECFTSGSVPAVEKSDVAHEESLAGYLGRYQVVTIVQQAVGACAALVPPSAEPLKYVGDCLRDGGQPPSAVRCRFYVC
eukprot:SAG11_NODE_17_length_26125_cov_45.892723_3_plen_150_part_00